MALVKFVQGTSVSYASLPTKDADTLYFLTDTRVIMKGEVPFSGGIYKTVSQYPEAGEPNVIYVNTTDGSVQFWNGSAYQVMVKPTATAISGAGDALHFPTTKAVVDYVATKVADLDVSAITTRLSTVEGKVKTIEGQIATINGTGTGSINKALADAKAYTDALKNGQVATNKTDIASLKTGKADKSTTLAGYGIGDAYTKTQADSAIAAAIAKAPHLKRAVVAQLPEVSAADANTIYMVGTGDGAETSNYKEYMLINGKFELLGDSKVDLTNYATKEYADTKASTAKSEAIADATAKIATAKSEAISAAATDATSKANAAKTGAVSEAKAYADGLADNYATAAQGAKADSALQKADIIEDTVNGAISVKGGSVKVHGLGSAAYANTTAFDAAGAASTAKTEAIAAAKTETTRQITAALTWGEL